MDDENETTISFDCLKTEYMWNGVMNRSHENETQVMVCKSLYIRQRPTRMRLLDEWKKMKKIYKRNNKFKKYISYDTLVVTMFMYKDIPIFYIANVDGLTTRAQMRSRINISLRESQPYFDSSCREIESTQTEQGRKRKLKNAADTKLRMAKMRKMMRKMSQQRPQDQEPPQLSQIIASSAHHQDLTNIAVRTSSSLPPSPVFSLSSSYQGLSRSTEYSWIVPPKWSQAETLYYYNIEENLKRAIAPFVDKLQSGIIHGRLKDSLSYAKSCIPGGICTKQARVPQDVASVMKLLDITGIVFQLQ
jgi:hypothetical protein